MLYRFGADLVLVLHLLFIVFVALGGLLLFWRRRLAWLHLPALLWGGALELCGWLCPLTDLEVHWLRRAGERGYEGGFVEHYLWGLIYPQGLTRGTQAGLGLLVLAFNAVIYALVFRIMPARAKTRR